MNLNHYTKIKNQLIILVVFLGLPALLLAGGGGGGGANSCTTLNPICTDVGLDFTAETGIADAEVTNPGNNYDCLLAQPNPTWYYIEVAIGGNINMSLSAPSDIDFIIYGPYSSLATATSDCEGYGAPAGEVEDCSFSATNNETPSIVGAVAGQVYVMLITNYASVVQDVTLVQTSGSGSTDCSIVSPVCAITGLTAAPSNCNASNQYSVTGTVTYTDPPTTGTLTVTNSCGGSQTFNAPFNSPTNYSITGLTPNGASCTITASFSATTCSSTATYTARSLPTTNASANVTICTGTSTTLTVTGANTYSWSPTTGLSPTTGASITANPTTTTTYTVVGTNTFGCTLSDPVTVTVNPLATVNSNVDQVVCVGGTITLAGSVGGSATSGTWSAPSGSFSNSSSLTSTYTPSITSGTVTLTLTTNDPSGPCLAVTDQMVVTVNPVATVNANVNQSVCAGGSVTLAGSVGGSATSGTWSAPSGSFSNASNLSSTYTPSIASGTVTLTLTTNDPAGPCVAVTDQMVITVNPIPTVNAGLDQAICIGQSVTLTGSGATTYTWNNSVTNGVAFSPSTTTTYTVTGTTAGCTNTDQVVVTVNPLPVVVSNNVSVCAGGSVAVTASGANTYSWSPATYLSASTGSSVTFTAGATTTYTVTGTSAAGCIGTDPVTVSVLTNAPINAGPDVAICLGASTTLTATGGATYSWNNGLGVGNGFTVSPATTTTYTVIGTDAVGCTGTDAITVTVNPPPLVNAGTDQTVCAGTSVTLTATGASTYSWDYGVTNGVAFTPSTTLTYTVTGTTAAGCIATDQVLVTVNTIPLVNAGSDQSVCTGTAVTLSGSGAATYTWNNGVTNGVSFTPGATNSYTVTGTSAAGCTATDVVTVSVLSSAPINAGTDAVICAGTSTTLTATGGSTYNWDNGLGTGNGFTVSPSGTTTYTVIGTDINGCIGTDAITVTVNPLPVVNAGTDQAVCNGTSVTLTATGASTYTWDNGVTNGVSFVPTITNTYTVIGTTAAGCTGTDQVIVTVNPLPIINAGIDQTVCQGTSVTLTATGASTYTWNNGANQGVAFTPAVGVVTYTATGTTAAGCTSTDQVTVTVNALPTTNAGADQTVCAGTSVTLTATGATTYSWDNGISNGIAFTPSVGTLTYTVSGTSAAGCITTDQVIVTVNPNPNPVIQGPTEYCSGNFATLSTSVPYTTYLWSTGATTATEDVTVADNPITVTVTNGFACQTTSATFTVTENSVITANFTETICQGQSVLIHGVLQSAAGVYSQTFTSATGCDSVANVTLVVNSLPAVNAGVDQAVCTGVSTTLTATGAANYTWNNGVTNGIPFTQAVGTITYTVTGTDVNGCINTDQVNVTVNPLPVVNAGSDLAICIGASATLSGSGASTYAWNNGVTNNTAFTPSLTNTYTVTGTDVNGCVNTDQVVVTVNSLPLVNAGADQVTCIGGSVTLSGSGAGTYTWNNGVTNGVAFSPAATNTYTVTGTDANGCINTDQAMVTVNSLPTVNAGPDQIVCIGTSVTLSGTGASTYSWNNGVTNGVAFIPAVGTITYTVTGTSGANCVATDQVNVTVNPLPVVSAGIDQAICIGASATLSGSGAVTYTWNNGVTNNISFTPSLTNTYTVTGTDANGCTNTDQVIVTVNPLPNVSAGLDQTICEGASVTVFGSGAATYTWNNGVTNGVPFSPTTTNTYTVTGTNGNGCINTDQMSITVNPLPNVGAGVDVIVCEGTAVTLNGSGASTYSWTSPVINGVAFTQAVGTMTYTVTGTSNAGCINTDQVTVTVNPLPIVNAGPDQSVCAGTAVTLSGSGANSYTWNNGVTNGVAFTPIVTNTYTATGTSIAGCVSTDQVMVTVNPIPTVFAGNDLTLCENQTAVLTGSGANTYSWDNGVVNGTSFTPPIGTTIYTVIGTTTAGCTNTDQVSITVNPNPTVSFLPDVTAGCTPLTVNFTNTTANSSNCVWTISNGNVLTGCGTVSSLFSQPGCFDVTLTTTSTNGCTSSFTASNLICVENPPVAAFTTSDNVLSTLNTEVLFFNETQGSDNYEWNFGDDSALTDEENPIHLYSEEAGTYEVYLVAISPLGCVDTAFATIVINEALLFYVPNTFTPDYDSYNQTFSPVFTSGFDPYDYTLLIFNRWGDIIFESHDASIGWNGSFGNGGEIEMVQDGVYTWKIEFKVTANDERKMAIGHVNILR